jgi:mannose-1-phosphate guanylyltransferase
MKAILLSAGYGTRLRPVTNKIPKCLIKINNQTLIDIWIKKLIDIGVNSILINTHYLPKKIFKHINNSPYKKKIIIKYEKKLLNTGGTLIRNLNFFKDEEGLLIHSDNLCFEGLDNFMVKHKSRPKQCLMTMMAFPSKGQKDVGIIKKNRKNILINFFEKKNIKGNLANCAVYIFSNKFIKILKTMKKKNYSFSDDIIKLFFNKIYIYKTKDFFIDIGNIYNLRLARKIARQRNFYV